MLITLSESDRQRLGCPDRLPVKLDEITAREASTLREAFGYRDVVELAEAFDAMFVFDDDGKLTAVRRDAGVFLAFAWLALRRNGYFTARGRSEMVAELDGLDIELAKVGLDVEEEAVDAQ